MKKTLATLGLLLIFIGLFLMKKDDINTIINKYFKWNNIVTLGDKNEYYRDYDFDFVQNTNNFRPNNYQDLLNIYYTVLNAGKSNFTFYCPNSYDNCLSDVKKLANDQDTLSDINNYVHPYNGFNHIESEYDSLGRVTINIIRSYDDNDIKMITSKIDELLPQLVSNTNSLENNIKNVHDYIINNSKYDSNRSDKGVTSYKSDTAYGPLFEGYALCGGYTDLMELFLERMNIKSFKVSSENHIWNAVYINNNWKHLDLTWDDPVATDGKDYLEYNYFLIDTDQLLTLEQTEHNFNLKHYKELTT
mgnify:FL=1